jgi:hypothetical protein
VLGNWAETPFFLQLQHEKSPDDADMSKTVFQDKIEELTYFKRDIIAKIVESIFYAVKARSLKYRTEVKEAMPGSLKVVACISITVRCYYYCTLLHVQCCGAGIIQSGSGS